jgi:hypothetical protein
VSGQRWVDIEPIRQQCLKLVRLLCNRFTEEVPPQMAEIQGLWRTVFAPVARRELTVNVFPTVFPSDNAFPRRYPRLCLDIAAGRRSVNGGFLRVYGGRCRD